MNCGNHTSLPGTALRYGSRPSRHSILLRMIGSLRWPSIIGILTLLKPFPANRGFTLVEVLVVVAIITTGLLVAFPVARTLMKRSHAVTCAANLRQIGLATMLYAGDNHMTLPVTSHQRRQGGKSWTLTLQPYAGGTITFKCAQDPALRRPYTYLINDFLTPNPAGAPDLDFSRLAKLDRPGETVMFAEASPSYLNTDHFHFSAYRGGSVPPEMFMRQVATRAHGDSSNYLFADGHVETLRQSEALSRLSTASPRFIEPNTDTP
jgi:prepilin-type N-terminal cleavage/methylation domain-containing protein/prepilin-type processing-associated H-X9-DG protein